MLLISRLRAQMAARSIRSQARRSGLDQMNEEQAEGFSDPGNLPFAEVFICTNADALVTGNLHHFVPLVEKGLLFWTQAVS